MKTETTIVKSKWDELPLEVLLVQPEDTCHGVIQIVHGMAEHKERYLPFMEFMAEHGYASVIHDHRGHGKSVKSEEDLGYFYGGGKDALVEDTYQVTCYCKELYPTLPVILLGHSMGSLVVRNYIKKYDDKIDILINSGAPCKNGAVDAGMALIKVQKKLHGDRHRSNLIQNMAFGGYAVKFRKEKSVFAWICSEPTVVEEYDKSSTCGYIFTLDGFWGLFELLKGTYNKKDWKMANPGLPILFLAGEDDPCIGSPKKMVQAMKFLKNQGYVQVTGKTYPGMRHEIMNETNKMLVYHNILSYIEKHLNGES